MISRAFVFLCALGVTYIAFRAVAVGQVVPIVLGLLLALCATGLALSARTAR